MITHPTSFLQNDWIADFQRHGFVAVARFVDEQTTRRLKERFEPLFAGTFETGNPPDDWAPQPASDNGSTVRHMINAWKCDRSVARCVLSLEIGELAATLAGWSGTRLGHDELTWASDMRRARAPLAEAHWTSAIEPPASLMFTISLDDAPGTCIISRDRLPETAFGGRDGGERRLIIVHVLSAAARFRTRAAAGIYGRYRRFGETTLDEAFFPVLWTRDGYRSPFIAEHLGENPALFACSDN